MSAPKVREGRSSLPSRTSNPEYQALRATAEDCIKRESAARHELLNLLATNGYLLRLVADFIDRDCNWLSDADVAREFRSASDARSDASTARADWIDAHPEYR